MKQFEIWWADLPGPIGTRPVLVLTRTQAHAYLNKAMVAEITRTVRGIAQEVALGPREGLSSRCVANLDNVRMVERAWFTRRAGTLSPSRWHEVKRALGYALDWPELKAL